MDIIKKIIRPEVLALSAYHVPQAQDMLKLDAMENPYTWPQQMREQWQQLMAKVDVNRYPDPSAQALKSSLRKAMSIPDSLDIMLGNGSDELIQIICMAVANHGKRAALNNLVLSLEPSFVMYHSVAQYLSMDYVGVPLSASDFSIDIDRVEQAIKKHKPAVVFIATPNNPTGNSFDESSVERIISCAPGLVVIDEAYQPFAQKSILDRLDQYDNVLLMRTVSKIGLAGLRLGYLIAKPQWLQELDKLRMPYNINVLTQASAEFALQYINVLDQQAALIREQRTVLLDALNNLDGLEVFPSATNFVLFRTENDQADSINEKLRANKVLIKKLDGAHALLKDCLRVTVGTPEQNQQFIAALKLALSG